MGDSGRIVLLGPLVAAEDVSWDRLVAERKRAVVDALMTVTLHSPGQGRRPSTPPQWSSPLAASLSRQRPEACWPGRAVRDW